MSAKRRNRGVLSRCFFAAIQYSTARLFHKSSKLGGGDKSKRVELRTYEILDPRTLLAGTANAWLDLDPVAGSAQAIVVQFSEDVGASLQANDLELFNLSTNQAVPVKIPTWNAVSKQARFEVNTSNRLLPNGNYEVIIIKEAVTPILDYDLRFQTFFLQADRNRDRVVNTLDEIQTPTYTGPGTPPVAATWSNGDLNLDGVIDFERSRSGQANTDADIYSASFGATLAAPPSSDSSLTLSTLPITATGETPIQLQWLPANWQSLQYMNASGQPALPPNTNGYRIYRRAIGESTFHQVGADITSPVHPTYTASYTYSYPGPGGQTITGTGYITLTYRHYIFTDNTAIDGTKYEYKVRPFNNTTGNGSATDTKAATTIMIAPEMIGVNSLVAPSSVEVHFYSASQSATDFVLTWSDTDDLRIAGTMPITVDATNGPFIRGHVTVNGFDFEQPTLLFRLQSESLHASRQTQQPTQAATPRTPRKTHEQLMNWKEQTPTMEVGGITYETVSYPLNPRPRLGNVTSTQGWLRFGNIDVFTNTLKYDYVIQEWQMMPGAHTVNAIGPNDPLGVTETFIVNALWGTAPRTTTFQAELSLQLPFLAGAKGVFNRTSGTDDLKLLSTGGGPMVTITRSTEYQFAVAPLLTHVYEVSVIERIHAAKNVNAGGPAGIPTHLPPETSSQWIGGSIFSDVTGIAAGRKSVAP
jgi:hypothetical protein